MNIIATTSYGCFQMAVAPLKATLLFDADCCHCGYATRSAMFAAMPARR